MNSELPLARARGNFWLSGGHHPQMAREEFCSQERSPRKNCPQMTQIFADKAEQKSCRWERIFAPAILIPNRDIFILHL